MADKAQVKRRVKQEKPARTVRTRRLKVVEPENVSHDYDSDMDPEDPPPPDKPEPDDTDPRT
jgi:hypothetical protein